MIELKNIYKKFGNKVILNNLNLLIEDYSFCAIKGKSGCGKTTLFKIIALLDDVDGEIRIDGKRITPKNKETIRRTNLSYVFQEPMLLEYLTVYENIVLPLQNLNIKMDKQKVTGLLKDLLIENLKDNKVSHLSGGERTRVAIARALITEPNYVLMDEPIGNLDSNTAKSIMNLLKSILVNKKITMVMVTHSNDYDDLYSKIYYLDNGVLHE